MLSYAIGFRTLMKYQNEISCSVVTKVFPVYDSIASYSARKNCVPKPILAPGGHCARFIHEMIFFLLLQTEQNETRKICTSELLI